ncbi:MAG: IS256 family transposase, partial [Proteobacteria bacterium]
MTHNTQYTQYDLAMELLIERGFEGIAESIAILMNSAMQLERSRHLNAAPHERSGLRKGYANGYKPKTMNTRVGEVQFAIPQT